ncbi:MAG TPA: hypothetical protein VL282_01845 [Tepidisphaeraceae bacterium]|jgi:hypothetical protein|nr:hypothetical protein [Tepidisphaeraceae bacterium]
MNSLARLIQLAGIAQLGILIASALVPQVLNWRGELRKLSPMTRHLVWTHGVFIVLTIIAFAMLSLINATNLATGDLLARSVCAFIAIFWGARLVLQFALFDAKPYLTRTILKIGYHGLTVVFAFLAATFGYAALHELF